MSAGLPPTRWNRLGWKPDRGEAGAAYWLAEGRWDECVKIGAPAVQLLIDALKSPAGKESTWALGKIGDPRALKPLMDAFNLFNEDDPDMGMAVYDALLAMGGHWK